MDNPTGEVTESFVTDIYYHIDEAFNKMFDCVGCPFRVCYNLERNPETCGYMANPKIDLTNMEEYKSLVPNIIVLPRNNTVSYNRSTYADSEYFRTYFKDDDEFWLDSAVDPEQCESHALQDIRL